jgi:hypothetical protein
MAFALDRIVPVGRRQVGQAEPDAERIAERRRDDRTRALAR